MTPNLNVEQWLLLIGNCLQICFSLLALIACFRYRYLSWAIPVVAVGVLGQLSVMGLSTVVLMSQQLWNVYSQPLGIWLFTVLRLINVVSWICVNLGLVLLMVDFFRQLQLWRESAGESASPHDQSSRGMSP